MLAPLDTAHKTRRRTTGPLPGVPASDSGDDSGAVIVERATRVSSLLELD
jgi:hypothetical protein